MSLHDEVKKQVLLICKSLGFQAKEEYRGKDWRSDVFVSANDIEYAFEIQITRQSLNRTLERQKKYTRDGIIGCWFFEKGPARMEQEREDLPLFLIKNIENMIIVSIKDRNELPLEIFIRDFLQNKIKFCQTLRMHKAEIRFVRQNCWKCGFEYHIYYVGNFISPCNTKIFPNEALWVSNKLVFKPEIATKVNDYIKSVKERNLNIGTVKERYSKTTESSYVSFGCPKCDAIFGDWYFHETIINTFYGNGIVDKILIDGNFTTQLGQSIPHWCHPGEHKFCE